MKEKIVLWLFSVLSPLTMYGNGSNEVINVTEAGTLRELVAELESTDIQKLTIKGNVNATDIKYLREQAGRLANLEELDITDVSLVPSDEPYYSYGVTYDMLWSYGSFSIYISDHNELIYEGLASDFRTKIYRVESDCLAYAFTGMNLKKIALPSNFSRIGEGTFKDCIYLESVEMPNNIQAVESKAFYGCQSLQSLDLSPQLTFIGIEAFYECINLRGIGDISHVTELGTKAFYECNSFAGNANGVLDISSLNLIPEWTFNSCSFSSIKFSSGLKEIQKDAFYKCKQLTSIVLPESLEVIGSGAFHSCSKLAAVTLPANLANIGTNAFANTPWYNNLQSIDNVIYVGNVAEKIDAKDASVISIREGTVGVAGEFASKAKNNLSVVNIPSTLRYIGAEAFSECKFLERIELPDGLEEIGDEAFYNCTSLSMGDLPQSLRNIGSYAFQACPLKNVELTANIESIGNNAFSNNNSLITVSYNVPDAKGHSIFQNCNGLEEVTIGKEVKVIPERAFEKCTGLIRINFEERTEGQPLIIAELAFSECSNLNDLHLPIETDSIGGNAFYGCKLTTLDIPEGVRAISGAFTNCQTVTLTLPESIERCGAFSGMTKLKTLYYNIKKLKDDDSFALYANTSIEKIVVGSKVQVLSGFRECTNLKELVFLPRSTNDDLAISDYAFYKCSSLQAIDLPEGIKSIGGYAFYNCSAATALNLSSTIEAIGGHAFEGAFAQESNFTELSLSNSIKSIEGRRLFYGNKNIKKVFFDVYDATGAEDLFEGMIALEEIVIGKHVRTLPYRIMANCSYMTLSSEKRTKEDIPLTIKNGAFYNSYFTSIVFPYGTDSICGLPNVSGTLYIPETVTHISWYGNSYANEVYYNAKNIDAQSRMQNCTYLTIGKDVEKLPKSFYSEATNYQYLNVLLFESREGQTSLEIGEYAFRNISPRLPIVFPLGTTVICDYAFNNATAYEFVLPLTVTTIGKYAFNTNNSSGILLKNYQQEPILLTEDLMEEEHYAKAILQVPLGSKEKYEKANIWKKFNIVEFDAGYSGIEELEIDSSKDTLLKTYYSLDGRHLSTSQRGLNIVRMNDGTAKKVVKK